LIVAKNYLLQGNLARASAAIRCAGQDLPAGHSVRTELISLADALFAVRL
jgi:cellobiose-specific phosphotransferase system component IIA